MGGEDAVRVGLKVTHGEELVLADLAQALQGQLALVAGVVARTSEMWGEKK